MYRVLLIGFLILHSSTSFGFQQPNTSRQTQSVSGDAVIRAAAGDSEIVVTTTSRLAGAIHSLTWNGVEFIDSVDHGRQLQSACSFDCLKSGEYWAECYNPTEAGSRADGAGPTSTSKLLSIHAEGNRLSTKTQMAFWLLPGEDSSGRPALNSKPLSDVTVTKEVILGFEDMSQVIDYRVAFEVPETEHHRHAVFEALTGYMPARFEKFWGLDSSRGELVPLTDGPGEQSLPVILATKDNQYAMGVFSPDQPSNGFEHVGYGRFRFEHEQVTKWNCVFRVSDRERIAAKTYRFRMFVAIGTLEQVRSDLSSLASRNWSDKAR
jgi:hypothetical protein